MISKSVVVKYDLPPYMVVHNIDRRLKPWGNRVPTKIGYFEASSILAIVDRKAGEKLAAELEAIRDCYCRTDKANRNNAKGRANAALRRSKTQPMQAHCPTKEASRFDVYVLNV